MSKAKTPPAPEPLTTKEVLEQAREFIDAGWIKGSFYVRPSKEYTLIGYHNAKKGDCMCTVGAIAAACRQDPWSGIKVHAAVDYLLEALGRSFGYGYKSEIESLMHWNDKAQRTKDQVLEAFDKAIELATRGLDWSD